MIKINNLSKYFGRLCAVDAVDLHVNNEIFGLLGPNGAGKSTIVRILVTLLRPTKGSATICGFDITKNPKKVRSAISYVPQEMALDTRLTGKENVLLYAKLYGIPDRINKVNEVLELMDLTDRCDDLIKTYSGGMRRRLELAQALVHEPQVLFLDEPTLGLDVSARKRIWNHILSLREHDITIFMTTHYMEEADEYCDRVAIIDKGRITALGTPQELKSSLKISEPTLNDVFMDKISTREDESAFDGYKFRTMLRRRS